MAKKKAVRTNKTNVRINKEEGAYARIEVWKHTDGGNVRVKAYDATNQQIVPDRSEKDEKIMGLGVHVSIKEDKTVYNDGFYEKNVNLRQYRDNVESSPDTNSETVSAGAPNTSASPDGLFVLKNFVDNIAEQVRQGDIKTLVVGGIAVAALVLSVVAFAIA